MLGLVLVGVLAGAAIQGRLSGAAAVSSAAGTLPTTAAGAGAAAGQAPGGLGGSVGGLLGWGGGAGLDHMTTGSRKRLMSGESSGVRPYPVLASGMAYNAQVWSRRNSRTRLGGG